MPGDGRTPRRRPASRPDGGMAKGAKEAGTIVLARHGEPALSRQMRLSAADYATGVSAKTSNGNASGSNAGTITAISTYGEAIGINVTPTVALAYFIVAGVLVACHQLAFIPSPSPLPEHEHEDRDVAEFDEGEMVPA